jgi:hypothetical protein
LARVFPNVLFDCYFLRGIVIASGIMIFQGVSMRMTGHEIP